jgi:hypothetical protein
VKLLGILFEWGYQKEVFGILHEMTMTAIKVLNQPIELDE